MEVIDEISEIINFTGPILVVISVGMTDNLDLSEISIIAELLDDVNVVDIVVPEEVPVGPDLNEKTFELEASLPSVS